MKMWRHVIEYWRKSIFSGWTTIDNATFNTVPKICVLYRQTNNVIMTANGLVFAYVKNSCKNNNKQTTWLKENKQRNKQRNKTWGKIARKIEQNRIGRKSTANSKAAFIVHCSCVAVSCSGRISVSATTTALRYCKEVYLRCSALRWAAVDK